MDYNFIIIHLDFIKINDHHQFCLLAIFNFQFFNSLNLRNLNYYLSIYKNLLFFAMLLIPYSIQILYFIYFNCFSLAVIVPSLISNSHLLYYLALFKDLIFPN